MIRKATTAFLCIILAAAMAAGCGWTDKGAEEISGDDFFDENKRSFTASGENFYTNSPEDAVLVYENPGGETEDEMENGENVTAYYIYTDDGGTEWAIIGAGQYIEKDNLLSVYDQEFFDDNADAITEELPDNAPELEDAMQGQMDSTESGGLAYLSWNYPHGLASAGGIISDVGDTIEGCDYYYTDPYGLVWGYYEEFNSEEKIWICLSDIFNMSLAENELYTGKIYFDAHGTVEAQVETEELDGYVPSSQPQEDETMQVAMKNAGVITSQVNITGSAAESAAKEMSGVGCGIIQDVTSVKDNGKSYIISAVDENSATFTFSINYDGTLEYIRDLDGEYLYVPD